LEKFFQHQGENKNPNRQSKITHHWIGYDDDKPFVYLLTSNVLKNTINTDEYSKYSKSDRLAIILDIFIGDSEYLGTRYPESGLSFF
jgi:hypothetical protein